MRKYIPFIPALVVILYSLIAFLMTQPEVLLLYSY